MNRRMCEGGFVDVGVDVKAEMVESWTVNENGKKRGFGIHVMTT